MTTGLQHKIDFAIKLLRSIPTDNGPVEISYSGGMFPETAIDTKKFLEDYFKIDLTI